jgi:hypothetical protein
VAWAAQAGWGAPHQARQAIAGIQENELSRAGRCSPATIRRKRMPPISQLKQVVLLRDLTEHVRVYSQAAVVSANILCIVI